ncbi:MAG: peptide deformylase [Bradymonadia bacterium]
MSQILPILPFPNPFLRERAAPVEHFDDALEALVENMKTTMHSEEGLGLAATQVGVGMRLLLLSQQAFKGDAGKGLPDLVVINPEVVWQSEETEVASEGCLSFPGVYIPVERPLKVRIEALDAEGNTFHLEGEGLGARAILHEIDHLNGVVMTDHVSHLQRKRALKKHQRNQRAIAQSERA